MGKWTQKSYDDELLKKMKVLLDEVLDKLKKEQVRPTSL